MSRSSDFIGQGLSRRRNTLLAQASSLLIVFGVGPAGLPFVGVFSSADGTPRVVEYGPPHRLPPLPRGRRRRTASRKAQNEDAYRSIERDPGLSSRVVPQTWTVLWSSRFTPCYLLDVRG